VGRGDAIGSREVGDGAGDAPHTVDAAGRPAPVRRCRMQHAPPVGIERARLRAAATRAAHVGRGLADSGTRERRRLDAGHFHLLVDEVEERAAQRRRPARG